MIIYFDNINIKYLKNRYPNKDIPVFVCTIKDLCIFGLIIILYTHKLIKLYRLLDSIIP